MITLWGRQNTKCPICGKPSTQTFQTVDEYDEQLRIFERLCASCLYWSAWYQFYFETEKIIIGDGND